MTKHVKTHVYAEVRYNREVARVKKELCLSGRRRNQDVSNDSEEWWTALGLGKPEENKSVPGGLKTGADDAHVSKITNHSTALRVKAETLPV